MMKTISILAFLLLISSVNTYAMVDTFYVETTDVYMRSLDANYTTAHDMQKPNSYYSSTVTVSRIGQIGGTTKYIERTFVAIITSSLSGAVTINSATFHMSVTDDWSTTDFDISIMKGLWLSDPPDSAEFEFGVGWDTSEVGGSLNTSGLGTGWKSITLNSTGLSWINKTGTTRFCLVSSRDLGRTISGGDEHIQINSADEELYKPYFVVDWTGEDAPPYEIQSMLGPGVYDENDSIRADNAPDYDTIDAYETEQDDKNVHLAIQYFPSEWNGHKYWMGYTPYPGAVVENPNIVVSEDGHGWEQPSGISNPINAWPGGAKYNSDIDLFMHGDTMYCGWRRYEGIGDSTMVLLSRSLNGTAWSDEDTLFSDDDPQHVHLSPSWIWDDDDSIRCYYASGGGGVNHIWYRKADHPLGPYNSPVQCTVHIGSNIDTLNNGRELWHPNIKARGDTLFAVIVMCNKGTGGAQGRIHFARSTDWINFYMTVAPFLDLGEDGNWDDWSHYRSGMVWNTAAEYYELFYTGNDGEDNWRVGHTNLFLRPERIVGMAKLYDNGDVFSIYSGD